MWTCPICSGEEKKDYKCVSCGFDEREDFVRYRTVCPVNKEDVRNRKNVSSMYPDKKAKKSFKWKKIGLVCAAAAVLVMGISWFAASSPSEKVKRDGMETADGASQDESETVTKAFRGNTLNAFPAKDEKKNDIVYVSDVWIASVSEKQTTLCVEVLDDSGKCVTVSYQSFLLDGTAVEDWKATENPFTMEPPTCGRAQPVDLNVDIREYSELAVQALVRYDGETEGRTISATFQINELETLEDKQADMAGNPSIIITEQEVYNKSGVKVKVPDQEITKNGCMYFTIECNWKYGAGFAVRHVYVNNNPVYEEDWNPNGNQFAPNEPFEWSVELGEKGRNLLLDSTSEDNTISMELLVVEPGEIEGERFTVTIPVIVRRGY